MRVIISGQKYLGEYVLRECVKRKIEVVAVVSPLDDKYLTPTARLHEIPVIPAGTLRHEICPEIDLGICAHSFDYIGKRTRYKAKIGWLGFHPSLLPRHRGRSAVEWALRMKDPVTGGSLYWLDDGVDRGDIAYQEWCFIGERDTVSKLWRNKLVPIAERLFCKALEDVSSGVIRRFPQPKEYSTFEPGLDQIKDVYRPDALLLESGG
ncbi:MAG: formyltransferase family protein [Cyclobacteriaceae bacterium]